MAQGITFDQPVSIVFKRLELDRIDTVDIKSGQITGFYSLLRADGKRWRSLPFSISLKNATDNFEGRILNKLLGQVEKIDGVDVVITGTIDDLPEGTPLPLR